MALSSTEFQFLAELVRTQSANVVGSDKEYLINARLSPLARAEGLRDISELVARLRSKSDPKLQRRVIEAMMTGESLFFRDEHPFEALRKYVLPDLVKKRATSRYLNIWCAASSKGQEPYSLAMLLHEHFAEVLSWDLQIMATDISEAALSFAGEGVYSKLEIERGLPERLRKRYFSEGPDGFRVVNEIRKMVKFSQLNLVESWPRLPTFDLIFIRNVLIYFDVSEKKLVLRKVRQVLSPEGYLILGGGETTLNIDDAYERVSKDRAMLYRLASPAEVKR